MGRLGGFFSNMKLVYTFTSYDYNGFKNFIEVYICILYVFYQSIRSIVIIQL